MLTPANPYPVGFAAFSPTAPSALLSGSWGIQSITATIAAQAFQVLMSPQYAGGMTSAQAQDLQVVATAHELFAGPTITPIAQGFVIDFGVAMVNEITLDIRKRISE